MRKNQQVRRGLFSIQSEPNAPIGNVIDKLIKGIDEPTENLQMLNSDKDNMVTAVDANDNANDNVILNTNDFTSDTTDKTIIENANEYIQENINDNTNDVTANSPTEVTLKTINQKTTATNISNTKKQLVRKTKNKATLKGNLVSNAIEDINQDTIENTYELTQDIINEPTYGQLKNNYSTTNEIINEHIDEIASVNTNETTDGFNNDQIEQTKSEILKNSLDINFPEKIINTTTEFTNETIVHNTIVPTNETTFDNISELQSLAKWHTNAEQKVYEAMYSETRSEGVEEWYFTFSVLTSKVGLRNARTLQTAIKGLIDKASIDWVTGERGSHFGKQYRVYEPKEVLQRRKEKGIKINPQTKRIV